MTIDAVTVVRAIRLAQRYRLSHWDGLIVQAAVDAQCAVLFSEDLQSGMRFGAVEVVNPFAQSLQQSPPAYPAKRNRATPTPKRRRN